MKLLIKSMLIVFSLFVLSACQYPVEMRQVTSFAKAEFPDKLSAWGLFEISDGVLVPHSELVPYDLNTPLFTDYAHKFRTLWLPAGVQLSYDSNGELVFPVGTIVSKTFYYPRDGKRLLMKDDENEDYTDTGLNLTKVRLVETRLMVRLVDAWHGLPYVWNEQQTEASLEITGAAFQFELTTDDDAAREANIRQVSYVVPDFNQCQGCHIENLTAGEMGLLGPKLRHLNKPYAHLGGSKNQLETLLAQGWIEELPDTIVSNVSWRDETASLEDRARSYLDINCGHCHNEDGPADTSGLFLNRSETRALRLGICKPPVAAGQGTGGHRYDIDPGAGNESILSYRMNSLDLGAMMPELGRSSVHDEGVELVTKWIDELPGGC